KLVEDLKGKAMRLVEPAETESGPDSSKALAYFLDKLARAKPAPDGKPPVHLRKGYNPKQRQANQLYEIDRHNQQVLAESPYVRRDFMPIADQSRKEDDLKKLDTSSVAGYQKSVERYRDFFAKEVIGKFNHALLPANPRTRKF